MSNDAFSPSEVYKATLSTVKASQQGERVSGSVKIDFSVMQTKYMVPSKMESYHLAVAGNQKQGQ